MVPKAPKVPKTTKATKATEGTKAGKGARPSGPARPTRTPAKWDAKLERLRREVAGEFRARTARVRRSVKRATRHETLVAALLTLLKALAVVVLPFLFYVRASVYLYLKGAHPWIAVMGAALLTMSLVAGFVVLISRRFRRPARVRNVAKWVALPLVFVWCVYATFYVSRVNTKTDAVRAYYGAVNPILRVALSTVVLIDSDLVVTDMGRVAADYPRMGLPVNDRTKHYRQPNGWVHAVDLRTRDRGEVRNRALQLYFWTMGFDTLRHVGTADHLHVQLAVRS